jgi:putative oxidoreductase
VRRLSLQWLGRYRDPGLLVLRGIPGAIFAYHGWQKLDRGVDGFSGFVDSLGVPFPKLAAWLVVALELVGGCMLIAGLFSRLLGVLFTIEMILTTALVKVDIGLIAESAGAELDLALLAAMVGVAVIGPGMLSFDRGIGLEGRAR